MEACTKRSSEDDGHGSPAAKRFHADLFLFDVLDTDDVTDGGLETVMKSLEVEIGCPSANAAAGEIGIGYLLEASDDELGLPPAGQSLLQDFGEICAYEDGGMTELGEDFLDQQEEGFGFDAGIFDLSEFYWRPESLPVL